MRMQLTLLNSSNTKKLRMGQTLTAVNITLPEPALYHHHHHLTVCYIIDLYRDWHSLGEVLLIPFIPLKIYKEVQKDSYLKTSKEVNRPYNGNKICK